MENNVKEKASRLAEDLKQTQVFTALSSQLQALNEDETAQNLVVEFDNLRVELMKKQQQGKLVPGETGRLHDLQQQIQKLDVFKQYMQARQEAVVLAQTVEKELSEVIGLPFAELMCLPSRGGCSPSQGGCTPPDGGCGCSC